MSEENTKKQLNKEKNDQLKQKLSDKSSQKKISNILIFCIMAVLSALIVIGGLFLYRKNEVKDIYYTEYGENFSRNEYSVFYMLYVTDFLNKYGSYLDALGLDVHKNFAEQQYDENRTWQDFFADQAENDLNQFILLNKDAKKTNTKIDVKTQVDDLMDIFAQNAETAGMDKASYLESVFGEGVTENDVRNAVNYKYSAIEYSNILYNGFKDQVKGTDMVSLYTQYPESFDKVLYRKFLVPTDTEFSYDGETEDDFIENAKKISPEADTLYADIAAKNESNESIVAWLYDNSRKYGDIESFDTEDGEIYVFFKDRNQCSDKTVDLRVIYFNTYKSSSDEKAEIKNIADAVYSTLLTDNSEDTFATYALIYSDDTLSKDSGGLITGLSENGVPVELKDWVFDNSRKQGDMTLTENDNGYYILYYSKENEEYWKMAARSYLADKAYDEYVENLKAEYTTEK